METWRMDDFSVADRKTLCHELEGYVQALMEKKLDITGIFEVAGEAVGRFLVKRGLPSMSVGGLCVDGLSRLLVTPRNILEALAFVGVDIPQERIKELTGVREVDVGFGRFYQERYQAYVIFDDKRGLDALVRLTIYPPDDVVGEDLREYFRRRAGEQVQRVSATPFGELNVVRALRLATEGERTRGTQFPIWTSMAAPPAFPLGGTDRSVALIGNVVDGEFRAEAALQTTPYQVNSYRSTLVPNLVATPLDEEAGAVSVASSAKEDPND